MTLRIGLFGNTANNFYQMGKALTEHTDFDVRLFIDDAYSMVMLPESDDPQIKTAYPTWIHRDRYLGIASHAAPWAADVTARLRECDLVVVSGIGPVFAQFTGRPWCFFVTGGDLTVAPFPLEHLYRYRGLKGKLGNLVIGGWQRRAVHRATEIWSQPFWPFRNALERLRVDPAIVSPEYFPIMLDTDRFRADPAANASSDPTVRHLVDDYDFRLFLPARILIKNDPALRAAGQWKNSDLLIRAFARFVRAGVVQRPVLAMPDRTESPDVDLAKRLVAQLGIEQQVLWMRPPDPAGYTRDELMPFYSVADVVADDFGPGWFGAVALEALATERPLVTYVDEAAMRVLYPWHPMLSSDSEEGVAALLADLARDPGRRRKLGRRGREWVVEFHSKERASERYARNIAAVAKRVGLDV